MKFDLDENKTFEKSGWFEVCQNHKSTDNRFLRVKPGCDLKVRLIGAPFQLVKIFTEDRRCIYLETEELGKQL